jgi:hypothetical protein
MVRRRHRVRRRLEAELDLHGVRHGDVSDAVHRFVNDHWVVGWRLLIITGNSQEMRRLVVGVLRMYDVGWWDSEWNPGVIVVDIS